jgi:hypothetical protein
MPKRYPKNLEGKHAQVGENEYFAYFREGNELFDLLENLTTTLLNVSSLG